MNLCPDAIPRVHFRRRIQRSFLAACVSAAAFAHALDIRIDTDNLKISGDGDDSRLKGAAFRADISNGIARFFIPGDVTIGSADTVSVAGARPAMLDRRKP